MTNPDPAEQNPHDDQEYDLTIEEVESLLQRATDRIASGVIRQHFEHRVKAGTRKRNGDANCDR